jgi:hypothetical protein
MDRKKFRLLVAPASYGMNGRKLKYYLEAMAGDA